MDIDGLSCIITQWIANLADGRSVEELRQVYNLNNDLTPEEEAAIRERFSWHS